jgi:S-DNA-T family DNA segregation ATPase FtsK/SpoIIIE
MNVGERATRWLRGEAVPAIARRAAHVAKGGRHVILHGADSEPDRRLKQISGTIQGVLDASGVPANVNRVVRGASVARFELIPAPGCSAERVLKLEKTIAMTLGLEGVRAYAPIPGRPGVGVEIPLPHSMRTAVPLGRILALPSVQNDQDPTTVGLGRTVDGQNVTARISRLPHLLIAGSTGGGKSEAINAILVSLLTRATPDQVRLVLIDPKRVELAAYSRVAHLARPVATTAPGAEAALVWVLGEMERRYGLLEAAGVRDITRYNRISTVPLPRLITFIDEMADLFNRSGSCEESAVSIASLGRAAGVHLVAATQRPDAKMISPVLKSNVPSRLAFLTSDQVNSRVIIDQSGAEKLSGRGDGLFLPPGVAHPIRLQGALASERDIEHATQRWNRAAPPAVDDAPTEQPEMGSDLSQVQQAALLVISDGSGSVARVKNIVGTGHSRAVELMDQLQRAGVVGPNRGTKARELLVTQDDIDSVLERLQ